MNKFNRHVPRLLNELTYYVLNFTHIGPRQSAVAGAAWMAAAAAAAAVTPHQFP